MSEYSISGLPTAPANNQVSFTPFGTAILASEVEKRLAENLYKQLSDDSETFVLDAISRAQVYIGTLLHWKKVKFNLDNQTIREIVLMQTLYELHMALGHEESGREFRNQMKNAFIAAYGSFPDSDNTQTAEQAPAAQVVVPPRNQRLHKLHQARRLN